MQKQENESSPQEQKLQWLQEPLALKGYISESKPYSPSGPLAKFRAAVLLPTSYEKIDTQSGPLSSTQAVAEPAPLILTNTLAAGLVGRKAPELCGRNICEA